jgi:hypothetical protein
LPEKPPAFDAHVLPRANREVLVVVEERDRVLAELGQVPASRVDDRAVAIERAVRNDVLAHLAIIIGRGRFRDRDLANNRHRLVRLERQRLKRKAFTALITLRNLTSQDFSDETS